MATTSYGCSSPGRCTVMASFLDTTLATSTVGVDAALPCALVVLAEEPEFEPHEMHKQTLLAVNRPDTTLIRLIELLPAKDSDCPSAGRRKRFGDLPDRATGISLRLVPGPSKTPAAGSAESQRWQMTARR